MCSLVNNSSSFRNFQIWDLPGQIDFLGANFDTESIYGSAGAVVWVIDAQDDYVTSVARFTEAVLTLSQQYPDLKYSVFIHKIDSLSTDFCDDTVRDITQRITDDLNDAGLDNPAIGFYPTSVYDESIYEALSKVIQTLNPQLPAFENMINTVSNAGKFQKLYLYDVMTKLYIAADTSPVDMASYSVCADYIDTIVDLSEIYGWNRDRIKEQAKNEEGSEEVSSPSKPPPGFFEEEGSAESFISEIGDACLYLKEVNK